MIIVLCGFMGCGKSYLLERLKGGDAILIDLDKSVVESFNGLSSVVEIVAKHGWKAFRQAEHKMLFSLLDTIEGDAVIAAGGGSITAETIGSIVERAKIVWLDTPFEQCWKRIKDDPQRPLVVQGKSSLNELYCQRIQIYTKAHLRLDVPSQKQVNNTTDLIVKLDEAQRKD